MTVLLSRRKLPLLLLGVVFAVGAAPPEMHADNVNTRALQRIQSPPLGLPQVPIPDDNRPTAAKIALGRKLFFDRRLSHNGTMSCGMCHVPEQGFTNNELKRPIGVEGRSLRRSAPTILNVAYQRSLFHDGRETALETQVISPLLAHDEMANPSIGFVIAKIERLADYDGLFERAFDAGASIDRIGQAIASWERTLVSGNSPFDRWRYQGNANALDERQRQGFELFTGKAGCANCHIVGDSHALFTDHAFHNTGITHLANLARREQTAVAVEIAPGTKIPVARDVLRSVGDPPQPDAGRYEVTLSRADLQAFKTPSLRDIALTPPYMHNGELRTLTDVVRFYNRGGGAHPGLDHLVRPLGLNVDEIAAIVAFLESLTGDKIEALIMDARSTAVGN